MKQHFLYSLILAAVCIGCNDSLPNKENGDNYLSLESVVLPGENLTKALVLNIDKVNVYVRKRIDDGTYSDYITDGKATQTRFNYTNNSWAAKEDISLGEPAYILGCYPVADEGKINSENGVLKIPVKVLDTNTFDAATSDQVDYLYSTEVTAGPTGGSGLKQSISLEMDHALAQISFYILKSSDVSEDMTLKQIEISSRGTCLQKGDGGQMLLDGGTLTALTGTNSLILTGEKALKTQETNPNVTCLVAPMSAEEPSLSFNLTVTMAGIERTFTTSPTKAKWEKGTNYSYTITLNKIGGELTEVTIKGWETDASPNTSIGI